MRWTQVVFGMLVVVLATRTPNRIAYGYQDRRSDEDARLSSSIHHQLVFPLRIDHPNRDRISKRSIEDVSFSFVAFNRTFFLDVQPVEDFLSPSFHVMTLREGINESTLSIQRGFHLARCLYRGMVKNDASSRVSLNICNGLRGLIHTCHGEYIIEPKPEGSSEEEEAHWLSLVQKGSDDCDRNEPIEDQAPSTPAGNVTSSPLRARRSVSQEWNLEIMVAADSKMARYHGDNLQMYVLTLMASVALIYKDPSIGNNINIAVDKLVVMDEEQDRDIIFPSASKTLRNFCQWQQHQNDPGNQLGSRHDTAILLTREDLCRLPKTCDTLGLAQSGMVCDRHSSCAVIEDNGLSAAFTIAHELGHVLGIPHDDDKKCARFQEQGQRLHVMARMLDYNSHPWSWSDCSRHYVTTFLDAGYGHCLLNQPREDLISTFEHASTPAGELFDMDYQCELVFGHGSKICPYMPVCKRLWCTMEDVNQGGCRTQHMPWADGTKCGPDKSCRHGECSREPVSLLPPEDGQWGNWQSFGQCSRSCGGGIKRSVRECDSPRPTNGGRYCVGKRVRYRSCYSQSYSYTPKGQNIMTSASLCKSKQLQECPLGTKDFREEQCSAFNGKTFGFPGVQPNVKWVPHYSGIPPDDTCKLYCRAAGTAAYFLLKEKVIDGTSCGPDTFDLCINGRCMPAGCDHKLDSRKETDICGVCGGDDSTCKVVRGQFGQVQYGYNHVVMVPSGASNIDIYQYGHENMKDDNYLALKDANNTYILNGDFMISMFPKTLHYAGAIFEYSGSDTVIERINSSKQLQRNLFVQVLTVGNLHPPNITFQYTVSLQDQIFYQWKLEDNWSPCNSVCQGEQYRKAVCVNKHDGRIVSDGHCHEQERLSHLARVCNPGCMLRWHMTQATECSVPCGKGVKQNVVKCVQQMDAGDIHEIPDQFCAHIEPRPDSVEDCEGPCNNTFWKFGEWSQCSQSCGGGFQFRNAVCLGNGNIELPETSCSSDLKVIEQNCGVDDCPQWKVGEWQECSVTCGSGEHRRPYWCQQKDIIVSNELCNVTTPPLHVQPCTLPSCVAWRVGKWEACSVTCGQGSSKRSVECLAVNGSVVSANFCNESQQPEKTKHCEQPPCAVRAENFPVTPSRVLENLVPPLPLPVDREIPSLSVPLWKTGVWSQCSVTCGEGTRHREVICQNQINQQVVPDRKCRKSDRPSHFEICNLPACGQWISEEWSECSLTCGEGIQTRQVLCLLADGKREDEKHCDRLSRPPREQLCNAAHCPHLIPETFPLSPVIHNSVEGEYYWRTGSWGKCSKTCGGGIRRRQVACYDEAGQLSSLCDSEKKPVISSPCNVENCPEWIVGEWSKCSATCGTGIQTRQVLCVSEKEETVPHERCNSIPPEGERKCKTTNCLHWEWSPWSQCSVSCGRGTQNRVSHCQHDGKVESDDKCDTATKPGLQIRSCKGTGCMYRWKKKKWSKCSASCGKGYKHREVFCINGNSTTVPDHHCELNKPRIKRRCRQHLCPFTWKPNHWSECSQSCGKGIQTRIVSCHRVNAYGWIDPEPVSPPPNDSNNVWCSVNDKPSTTRSCYLGSCDGAAVWRSGPWLSCSVSCGKGRQRRRIHCYSVEGKRMANNKCDKKLRPQRKRKCWMRPCPPINCLDHQQRFHIHEDRELEIFLRGRYVTVYCAGMNTTSPREYITLVRGESDNYSEIYNKRLVKPETCPYRGIRYDSCDCVSDEKAGSGLTTFYRIAVNISSLQIFTHDFTFSQTHIGQPVAYGESGDCYSMNFCPQGRFSLSLLGTGFVVSPLTTWVAQGNHPSHRIRWLEGGQVIQGKCGGYCGKCGPDSKLGLLLEVAPP